MPTALVTGATGFVGSNLVAYLRKLGWDVNCLVRDAKRAASLKQQGATLHLGSLADQATIEHAAAGTDVVFHVAGRVRALNHEQFEKDNVGGTRHVMEAAAAQAESPTVVYVSSLAAGGPSRRDTPRRESDDDQPISDYGRSKQAAERAAATFADEVPLSVVRPPIIFGGADRASLKIFRGVRTFRVHPVPGYRKFPVSLVHVTDLCDAMVRIAQQGERVCLASGDSAQPGQGIYYVAAERTISYGELGKLVGQALGYRAIALPIPRAVFWVIGGAMEVVGQVRREPRMLNLDKIREAVAPGWVCSDEKLRRALGYQPAASLEQRFTETADWYREHGWL
ncbi:MAG: NAD-dependent epimerase/dehydratase family protein [Pirellulales bacterium]|nr:NAD-dependent epimerase/dehydratase family protein [Pirellulales bacterium]